MARVHIQQARPHVRPAGLRIQPIWRHAIA
jgi:hypothetical protein